MFHGGSEVYALKGFFGHFAVGEEGLGGDELCGGGYGWVGDDLLEVGDDGFFGGCRGGWRFVFGTEKECSDACNN